ncbi:MAG TPA: hypothetical protein VG937_26840 [Polyangiaceae bacterium]|nr:hypothetical protein [Polyangiaceae bacterium]
MAGGRHSITFICSVLAALLLLSRQGSAAPRLSLGPTVPVEESPTPVAVGAGLATAAFDGTRWLVVYSAGPSALWLAADGAPLGDSFPILDDEYPLVQPRLLFDGRSFLLADFGWTSDPLERHGVRRFEGDDFGPALSDTLENTNQIAVHDIALDANQNVWTVACTKTPSVSDCVVSLLSADQLALQASFSLPYEIEAIELEPSEAGTFVFTESAQDAITAYRLDADGVLGAPIELSAPTSPDYVRTLSVAHSADGYAVAWTHFAEPRLARLSETGQVLSNFVRTGDAAYAVQLLPAAGGYLLASSKGDYDDIVFDVAVQALDTDLQPRAPAVLLNQRTLGPLGLTPAGSNALLRWNTSDVGALRATVLNATTLEAVGPPPVDLSLADREQNELRAAPSGDRWLVTWLDWGSPRTVNGRLYDSNGSPRGDSFQIFQTERGLEPGQLSGGVAGWLLTHSWRDAEPVYQAQLVHRDGTPETPFALEGPAALAPREDGWLALQVVNWKAIVADSYDSSGARLSRVPIAEAETARDFLDSAFLAKTDGGFLAVWNASTQYEILLNRAIWSRRLNANGEPVEPAVRHTSDIFGPRATSAAASPDAAWIFLLQSSTSFTPLPITAPFQQVASGSVFAKAVAVAGQAVGGWVEPFMELSRFGLAKPGEGLSEQGALPIALTDLSSPMRAASAPTDNTLMLIGTAKTRRLGPSVKRGQFALLKVTEDDGGAGGAGGADDGGGAGGAGGADEGRSAGASDGGGNGGGTATTGGATGSSGGSTTGGTGGNHPTSGGTGGSSHAGESSEAGEAGRASGGNPSGGTRTTGGSAGRDSNSGGMIASGGDGSEPPNMGDSDGCGCRLVPKRASANTAGAALLVALAALARRKRRRTPAAMHSARA